MDRLREDYGKTEYYMKTAGRLREDYGKTTGRLAENSRGQTRPVQSCMLRPYRRLQEALGRQTFPFHRRPVIAAEEVTKALAGFLLPGLCLAIRGCGGRAQMPRANFLGLRNGPGLRHATASARRRGHCRANAVANNLAISCASVTCCPLRIAFTSLSHNAFVPASLKSASLKPRLRHRPSSSHR